jgi:hypothetical protein
MSRPTTNGVEGSQAHDARNDEAPGLNPGDSDQTTSRTRSVTPVTYQHDPLRCLTCAGSRVVSPAERLRLRRQREAIALRDGQRVIDLRES